MGVYKFKAVVNITRTITDANDVSERYTQDISSKHKTREAAEKGLSYLMKHLPESYAKNDLVINSSGIVDTGLIDIIILAGVTFRETIYLQEARLSVSSAWAELLIEQGKARLADGRL